MKKIYISFIITLMWLFSNAQSYYYYQGQRIGLQENNLIRCVELKHTITPFEAEKIHDILCDYCYDTEEYTPYLNKYYIKQDEYVDFMEACLARDSIIEMNSSYYTLNDTYSMYPTRTILVKTKTDIELGTILTSLSIPYSNIVQSKYNKLEYEIHLTKDKSLYYAAQLYETGLFTYAEPDFVGIVKPTGYEENTLFFDQWAVHNQNNNMNLLPAWEITTGYSKIKVAVIDDGVDLNHSDLADNLLEGYDAVRDSTSVCCGEYENEFDGHGTCCSGIIGAANNEIGIVGIAHTSKIVPIRFGHTVKKYHRESNHDSLTLHWDWVTHSNWIIDAFNHACYEDSADVLSCSFGFLSHSNALDNKLREVCENGRNGRGCIVVVSAGNTDNTSGPPADTLGFLSKHPNVISVGSINPCGERVIYGTSCGLSSSYNSCYGDSLDVVAPGINIPTTKVSDRYTTSFTGTSSAAPHVAGVAALVLSVNPCLTMEEVKYVIESTCTKIRPDLYDYTTNPNHPNGSWNIEVGYGLVNAYAAVQLAQQLGGYTYIKDTIVTGNVTWAGNKMIHDSLVVDSLAILTITDTVHVSSNARLIVRPGGKLIVDGGTLTSACAGEMWQGVQVLGNGGLSQNAANQGWLELKNGALIENARCAVQAEAGAVVKATNTDFRNNGRSVNFMPYVETMPGGGVRGNLSGFGNCTFTTDGDNLFSENGCEFTEHVRMSEVNGIEFYSCSFSDATAGGFTTHRGIYSQDAGFTLTKTCPSNIFFTDCVCAENYSRYNTFSGFNTAIEANTSGNQYAIEIDQTKFSGNGTAVRINGNNFVTVTRDTFDLTQSVSQPPFVTGLYLNNCSGYKVEGNHFKGMVMANVGNTTGVIVNNSGSADNTIYRNSFSSLNYGVQVRGDNGGADGGLQVACGSFSNVNNTIYLAGGATMKSTDNVTINNCASTLCGITPGFPGHPFPVNAAGANPANFAGADGYQALQTEVYYAAVRGIMADTVLDLGALQQWHTVAQPIADRYSLTETDFQMGIVDDVEGGDADYAQFHAMKAQLRDGSMVNWRDMTEAQKTELQEIAEHNSGRASEMAKGVLCFYHGICIEDGDLSAEDLQGGTKSAKTAINNADNAGLYVYPNPTDGDLNVEITDGTQITAITLCDLQGRVVETQNFASLHGASLHGGTTVITMQNIPAGVYILTVTDLNGVVYHQKIIKK